MALWLKESAALGSKNKHSHLCAHHKKQQLQSASLFRSSSLVSAYQMWGVRVVQEAWALFEVYWQYHSNDPP